MLEGRVAVVSGARGGIGAAIVERLAAAGAHVLASDLGAPAAPRPAGAEAFVAGDISVEDDVAAMVKRRVRPSAVWTFS